MYFEFESIQSQSESQSTLQSSNCLSLEWPLKPRHRRISSSSQSLRELIDDENIIENITPSHCDLYLITRKKLSQITTNTIKQNHDLRREVLLTSIHRNITSKSTLNSFDITSDPIREKSLLNNSQHESTHNSDQHFKNSSLSLTTPTCTTTMANTSGGTRITCTSTTESTPSSMKKRNLTPQSSQPNSDYQEEWKTTIKRLKVVHGIDVNDVNMDSDFDDFCDTDLNDLTNNFHRLKTPFS